jgi:hypothetical protein
MEAAAVSKIVKKATDTMYLPTVDIRSSLPKLRVVATEDETHPRKKKPHKTKLPTNVTNLTAISLIPYDFKLKKSYTILERSSQHTGHHVRVDPRMGFKKAFQLEKKTAVGQVSHTAKTALNRDHVNNNAATVSLMANEIIIASPLHLNLDRSRTDLHSQTCFRHISRSHSFLNGGSKQVFKHAESSLASTSNESGSSLGTSSLHKQSGDETSSLPSLSKTQRSEAVSTDPHFVYFKNNKYDLVEILNSNGTFSQETCLVVSSSRKSAYGRGPKQYVIKRLPILEGNKKETVTKIYENFNDLNGFKSNQNLNRLVDTYLSNDLRFFFIIQEYYKNNLDNYLTEINSRNELVNVSLALSWFKQVVHGVRYLHETCQILHGNIKPTNILFSRFFFKMC